MKSVFRPKLDDTGKRRVLRPGLWVIAVMAALWLCACAHGQVAQGGMSTLDEDVPDEDIPDGELPESVAPDTRLIREMNHVEAAHWVRLIASVERRLDGDLQTGLATTDDLFSLKVRLLDLVDMAMSHYTSFPNDLNLDLQRLLARIDRAIVSYQEPNQVSILEVPTYADELPGKRPFQFLWPVTQFDITSGFGPRRDPFTHKIASHDAIDLAADTGTLVFAAERGRVIFAGWRGRAGKLVIIDHLNGYKTYYAHLDRILTVKGLMVGRGQPVGTVGSTGRSTGAHLHFKISERGKAVDPNSYVGAILE